jgi:hypothetical protein
MSKSDVILNRIDLERAFKDQTKPNWASGKVINAFDTETSDGVVFMLSYAIDDFSSVIANSDIEELDDKRILDILTHSSCRSALNCWYNLDFDANAILSDILTTDQLSELQVTNVTTTECSGVEYEIKYVKGKFLWITDNNDHTWKHYDISQFFYTSLDNAAEEWLGENKAEGVNTSKFDNKEYVKDNWNQIKHYAEKDAILTQRLARALVSEAETLDIPMGMPISTGYLSAEYQRATQETKPQFGRTAYQSMFWDSYYGGRFEVFKRGKVGDIAAPDINSAYPAVMAQLPNPATLDWQWFNNDLQEDLVNEAKPFDYKTIQKADYGVVRATVTNNSNNPIQPFAYKIDGKVNYPVLVETEITVIKPIFEFAVNNGMVLDFELHEAWLGYENEATEYPFQFINDLYATRKKFEKEGKFKKAKLIKIVLNSLYGKTCQTTEFVDMYDLEEGEEMELENHESVYPLEHLSPNVREKLTGNVLVRSHFAGRRFNPFFASYITGMTRLELHKRVVEYDLVDETVMFATDCIMVEKEAYENSNFGELITTPNFDLKGEEFEQSAIQSLGLWDFDYKGNAFVVGSGVYEVEKPDGSVKMKTRGFIEKNLDGTLTELGQKHPNGIPLKNERPLTIGEVLISPERGNVSQFVENQKKLFADFDTKREWARDSPTFHDLLEGAENSEPIDLADRQAERMKRIAEETERTLELTESGLVENEVN